MTPLRVNERAPFTFFQFKLTRQVLFQELVKSLSTHPTHLTVQSHLFSQLLSTLKSNQYSKLLYVALKYGRLFVDSFSKLCLPRLQKMEEADQCDVLKSVQCGTRILQVS